MAILPLSQRIEFAQRLVQASTFRWPIMPGSGERSADGWIGQPRGLGTPVPKELLGLPRPEPATGEPERDDYVLERPVTFPSPDCTTSPGFIDLYRRGELASCSLIKKNRSSIGDPLCFMAGCPACYTAPE